MRALVRQVALVVLLFPAIAAGQEPAAGVRVLSLDDALSLAQRNSPANVQAENALRVGRATVGSALAQFLPALAMSAGASRQGGATFFQGQLVPYAGDPWSYGKGYSAQLQLFDGGERWFAYRNARASQRANEENAVVQRFATSFAVKQQYYAVLAARESEAAAQRQLEQANEQFTVTSAKVAAGALTRADSLRSAIAVGTARLALMTAQGNLRSANAALTRLVGSDVPVTAQPADTSQVPHIDVDSAALDRMAVDGPVVRQAAASADASSASRWAAIAPYLPSLSIGYNFFTYNTSPQFQLGGGPVSSNHSLQFSVSYSLFDHYRRELTLVTARAANGNAQATLRDARLAARQNLAQYLGAFRTAQETIALQQLQIAAAEEDVNAQEERYRLGASSLLDLLTAESALDQARAALIAARLQARTARAQVEGVIGRELP
ncbi:MAG TPA: TolC family protein [Gemmatimonadaceae bacterium]|jgi:outer membrane protein|nr:TolC family protein [Gemmatimonadaceae bacterium]